MLKIICGENFETGYLKVKISMKIQETQTGEQESVGRC